MGEHGQAVVGHVHGEIDEDVDAVAADFARELIVGQVADFVPGAGDGSDQVCGFVGVDRAGIAVDFELISVVGFEEGQDEEALGVAVEIGGDVADAEDATPTQSCGN